MSKRDFFRIIIKLFGLYSLVLAILYYLPSNIVILVYESEFWSAFRVAFIVAIVLFIYIALLRNVDRVIDWLRLDKQFDDDYINLGNFDNKKIVSLATILIGGFLIIDYLPSFLKNLYASIRGEIGQTGLEALRDIFSTQVHYFDWAISAINIIVGFILLTNYRNIGSWVVKTNEKNTGTANIDD